MSESVVCIKAVIEKTGMPGIQGEQGPPGPKGERGEKGDSPVRGVDYWTPEDIAEIQSYVDGMFIKRYGARRAIGQSSPTLERVWDAVGKTAKASLWGETPVNDFDNIYPWSHMRECNISVIDGKIIVNAYKGDPTFKRDGSNGHVAVEIPKFYIAPRFPGDGYEYWGVSATPIGGWRLPQAFIAEDGRELEKIYVATYNAAEENGKFVSKSGVAPKTLITRADARNLARATDSRCQLIDMAYLDVIQTLFTVEFATLNSQSVMPGAVVLNGDAYRPTVNSYGNSVTVPRISESAPFYYGQYIGIGTSFNPNTAQYRQVTGIKYTWGGSDSWIEIQFDGDAVNILTSHYVFSMPYPSGHTDNLNASSGQYATSDSDNILPCKYRGIENLWGNINQYIDGINILDWQAWVCGTPSQYADDVFEAPYKRLNYTCPTTSGVPFTMGHDERYPWAQLPLTVGASYATGYCDYYSQQSGTRIMRYGGGGTKGDNSSSGLAAGLWRYNAYNLSTSQDLFTGARIMWR